MRRNILIVINFLIVGEYRLIIILIIRDDGSNNNDTWGDE